MSRLTHTSLDPVVKAGSPVGSARGHLNTREGWAHALISHGPEYCGELGESVLTIGGLVAPFGYETSLSTTVGWASDVQSSKFLFLFTSLNSPLRLYEVGQQWLPYRTAIMVLSTSSVRTMQSPDVSKRWS